MGVFLDVSMLLRRMGLDPLEGAAGVRWSSLRRAGGVLSTAWLGMFKYGVVLGVDLVFLSLPAAT